MAIKNKLDKILDAIFGNKVKGRWIKIIVFLYAIVILISLTVFLSTNLQYEPGKGFGIKPWNVDVKVNLKKELGKNEIIDK